MHYVLRVQQIVEHLREKENEREKETIKAKYNEVIFCVCLTRNEMYVENDTTENVIRTLSLKRTSITHCAWMLQVSRVLPLSSLISCCLVPIR